MFKRISLVAILLAITGQSIFSQDLPTKVEGSLNLQKAIETALANSTNIRRALLSVQDAKQLENLAWAEVMPTIETDISYTRNIEIPVNFVPGEFFGGEVGSIVAVAFGTDNSWDGGLNVRQTLFRGQAFVGISSSSVFQMAQLENYRAVSQNVVTQTRQAYHAVLIAREQLRLQETTINRLKTNLDDNRGRARAGIIDDYEVLRLEVQLRNEEPRLQQSVNAIKAAYRNLKTVMGVSLEWDFEVVGDLSNFDVLSPSSADAVNSSLIQVSTVTPYQPMVQAMNLTDLGRFRGDLRILDYQIQLKKKEIASEKSMYMPTISANYNLRWSAAQAGSPIFFGDSNSRARFQTVGVTASLPLFDGMRRNTNIQRAIIA